MNKSLLQGIRVFLIIFILGRVPSVFGGGFQTLKGKVYTYSQLINRSSKTVIFLWTIGCPICISALVSFNRQLPTDDTTVEFFYVNIGDSKEMIERLILRLGLAPTITDNIVIDSDNEFTYRFHIIGFPTYIFFKDGNPIYIAHFINNRLIRKVYKSQ